MEYLSRLKIPVSGSNINLYTPSKQLITKKYNKVVIGQRGPYVEFNLEDLNCNIIEEADSEHYYFIELRTKQDNIVIYCQLRKVDYANYKIGRCYISPFFKIKWRKSNR